MANRWKYYYLAKSTQDRINAINILRLRGYFWHSKPENSGETVENEWSFDSYPILAIMAINRIEKCVMGYRRDCSGGKDYVSFKNLSKL